MLFTKNNKLWNERKENFLYIWLLQRITLYQNRWKIVSLDTIAFDIHIYINNPHWQSSRIIIFLCKYYIVFSDTLRGSSMSFSCCSLYTKEERLSYRKSTQENLCEVHHLLDCTPSFLCHFWSFFCLLPAFRLLRFYVEKFFLLQKMGGCWCPLPPQCLLPCFVINVHHSKRWFLYIAY